METENSWPVAAVLLAAGRSRRFGADNKLLAEIDGVPLVRRTAETLLASRAGPLIAVTGFDQARIAAALDGLDVCLVHNPSYDSGLGGSLARGISAVPPEVVGAMVCLADMPGTTVALVDRLLAAFAIADGARIVFPVDASGRQGNPVVWPRRFFAQLVGITGDKGGKDVLLAHAAEAIEVAVDEKGAFTDVDTPETLASWRSGGTTEPSA